MTELRIRPSVRQAHALLFLCAIPLAALLRYVFFTAPDTPKAVLLLGLLLFLLPLRIYVRSWSTQLTIENGAVRLRQGLLSQNVATVDLDRLEKISVRRTLWQRLWGIGDLVIETAAESGGLAVEDVDDPQSVADRILAASRAAKGKAS